MGIYKEEEGFYQASEREASEVFSQENKFSSESEMVLYIEQHKEEFAQILCKGSKLLSFQKEYSLRTVTRIVVKGVPNIRVDIAMLLEKDGKEKWWYVEVKNPRHDRTELRNAVAQCLEYKTCVQEGSEIVLISSVYNNIVLVLLREYNLPINVCFMNKNTYGVYKHTKDGNWSMP